MSIRELLAVVLIIAMAGMMLAVDPPPRAFPPLTPGKDTTVVTGPLDKNGLIDYETALNIRLKGKSTPDTNAVVLLLKAIGPLPEGSRLHKDYYTWLGTKEPPDEGAYLLKYGDFFHDEIRSEDNQAFFDRESELRTRPWTEKDEPKFAEWVKANEKPLKVIAEAAKRPDYFYPMIDRRKDGTRGSLIGCLLSTVQKTREVASILGLRVMFHCGNKNYDAAWRDVMTMHRLGRLVSRGACLIELLVGIAIDTIARGVALRFLEVARPTSKQALAWRDELAKLPPMPLVADKVDLMERFTFQDVAQAVRREGVRAATGSAPIASDVLVDAAFRQLDWDRVLKTGNKWYDRMVEAFRKPSRAERKKAFGYIQVELLKIKAKDNIVAEIMLDSTKPDKRAAASEKAANFITTFLCPSILKLNEASDRQEVHFHQELLAFESAAYFADHKKYPAKLADLVPKYAMSIPDDVYSGKPLIYKPTAKGYELYSVGTNEKDDGGHMIEDQPRGDDYGVRMPHSVKMWPPAGVGK